MRAATMTEPESPEAYSRLAAAAEAAYLYAYADAHRGCARAASLAPNDRQLRARYSEFHEKINDEAGSLHKSGN
jgi:hypothetical protein